MHRLIIDLLLKFTRAYMIGAAILWHYICRSSFLTARPSY